MYSWLAPSSQPPARRIFVPGGPYPYYALHQYCVVRRVWGASGVYKFLIFVPPTPPQDLIAGILSTHVRCTCIRAYRCTGVHGYSSTGIQQYKGTGVQQYRHTGIQRYRLTGVQAYRHTAVQAYWHTGIQQYRCTRIQRYRGTCMQGYMRAGRGRNGSHRNSPQCSLHHGNVVSGPPQLSIGCSPQPGSA